MHNNLKKISCNPECGFAIQSHDEREVLGVAMSHVKKAHRLDATEKDMKMRMQMV